MRRAAKPPRPSDTPPMLGRAKVALPLGGIKLAKVPSKGLLSNRPIGRYSTLCKGHALNLTLITSLMDL